MPHLRKHPKHPNLLDLARELAEGAGAGADLSPEDRLSSLLVLLSGTPIAPYQLGDPRLTPHLERASSVQGRTKQQNDSESRAKSSAPAAMVEPLLTRARRRLAEARAALPQDPARSVARAQAAHRLVARVGRRFGPRNTDRLLAAVATGFIANGSRIEGDLAEARAQMDVARTLERFAAEPDAFLSAELDFLEATLARDQRDLKQAAVLCDRAMGGYRKAGDRASIARVGLSLSEVYRIQGKYQKAEASARTVAENPELEKMLRMIGYLTLSLHLVELDRAQEARRTLEERHSLFEPFLHMFPVRVRHRWLEGRIAGALKEWEASEAGLREAFEEMVAHGNPYDAALVSLDLADLYRSSFQWDRLVPHAEELIPVLEGLEELHAEAARAVALYQDAMARGEYKSGFGNKLHRYLLLARNDRQYRFEE